MLNYVFLFEEYTNKVDSILDRIHKHGIGSISSAEKLYLDKVSVGEIDPDVPVTRKHEQIVMNAPLRSNQDSDEYRGILFPDKNDPDKYLLFIQQNFKGEFWRIVPSGWSVSNLIHGSVYNDPMGDEITIDAGQNWKVSGMRALIAEIKNEYPDIALPPEEKHR